MKWALSAALLLLPSLSFEMQLSDTAVREAYFLGQRNDQKTSDFLKLYAKSFPLPDKGPYISEIHLLTPFAQVLVNSSQHSTGYSAQQAVADYHRHGDTLLLEIRIEFTQTYTYDNGVRNLNDVARELNRQLTPEDFWQAFHFALSQRGKSFGPHDARSTPNYGSGPSDSGPSLRGAIVWLEFDAAPCESQTAQAEAITPDGQHITTSFDLAKLR